MKRTVKNGFFMSLFLVAVSQAGFAQTLKEFFNGDATALFLGVDFTKAKLIDDVTSDEKVIRDKEYGAINEAIITNYKKYSLEGSFHKAKMDHDIGEVSRRNLKIDPAQIKSTNTSDFHRFKEDDIATLVKGFDFGDKSGTGILIVMEAMSKSSKSAAIWVVFIDMKAKKVLLTERFEEKVSMAFGFHSYWTGPIKRMLEDIDDDKIKEWKAKYQ